MIHIVLDYNSIISWIYVLLAILSCINYVISIKAARESREKLKELDKSLADFYIRMHKEEIE